MSRKTTSESGPRRLELPAVRGHNEGTVFRRKSDGLWVAKVSLPDGRRRSAYARTKAKAKDELERLNRDLGRGIRRTRRLTIAELLRSWLIEVEASSLAPKTIAGYRTIARRHLIPGLGAFRADDLTPDAIDRWIAEMGGSPRSLSHRRAALRTALNWGIARRQISGNAVEGSKPVAQATTPPDVLTIAQAQKVIEGTAKDWLHPLWVVYVTTGMRESEALALTWDDLDLKAGTVRIAATLHHVKDEKRPWVRRATKNKRVRTIPLTRLAQEALTEHHARMVLTREASWRYYGHVFLNESGLPYHGTRVLLLWYETLTKLELPRVKIHELRHTAASIMLSLGYTLEDVKQILGHSTIRVTSDVYSHPVNERLRLVTEGLDRALRKVIP